MASFPPGYLGITSTTVKTGAGFSWSCGATSWIIITSGWAGGASSGLSGEETSLGGGGGAFSSCWATTSVLKDITSMKDRASGKANKSFKRANFVVLSLVIIMNLLFNNDLLKLFVRSLI